MRLVLVIIGISQTWHFPVDGLYRVTSLLIDWIGVHRATKLRCGVCKNPEMGGLCIKSSGSAVVIAGLKTWLPTFRPVIPKTTTKKIINNNNNRTIAPKQIPEVIMSLNVNLKSSKKIFSERERVQVRYMLSPVRLSSVRRLSVCNVGAPYSAGWNFRQFFFLPYNGPGTLVFWCQ